MRSLVRFVTRRQNILGLALIGFYVFVALAAPQLAPIERNNQDPAFMTTGRSTDRVPRPPSREAPLGTLPGQYNIYYTLVWGTRSALRFGLAVAISTASFGVIVGAISGYLGGLSGKLLMRITDAFLAVPVIAGILLFRQLLLVALQSTGMTIYFDGSFDPEGQLSPVISYLLGADPVFYALIMFSWMPYARITDAVVANVRGAEFMDAARALGASHSRIILFHLIPNTITPAIVLAARDIGAVVLIQATFTFIGVGGGSEWGELLVLGRDYIIGPGGNIFNYWWVFIPATLTLVLFGIGWNLLGDSLNEWLNPRNSRLQ